MHTLNYYKFSSTPNPSHKNYVNYDIQGGRKPSRYYKGSAARTKKSLLQKYSWFSGKCLYEILSHFSALLQNYRWWWWWCWHILQLIQIQLHAFCEIVSRTFRDFLSFEIKLEPWRTWYTGFYGNFAVINRVDLQEWKIKSNQIKWFLFLEHDFTYYKKVNNQKN